MNILSDTGHQLQEWSGYEYDVFGFNNFNFTRPKRIHFHSFSFLQEAVFCY